MPDVIVRQLGKQTHMLREELDMDEEDLKQYALLATRGSEYEKMAMDEVIDLTGESYDAFLYRTFVANLLTSSVIDKRIARAERRRDDIIKKYEERRRTLSAMKRSLIEGKQKSDVTEVDTAEPIPKRRPAT